MGATVIVTNTTLFHVAARHLGDATQWDRIARLNGLADPVIVGTVTLSLPIGDVSAVAMNGGNGR